MSKQKKKQRRAADRGPDEPFFKFDLTFPELGIDRIAKSADTRSWEEFGRRKGVLTKLAEAHQVDVLRAFKEGKLTIGELVKADRDNELTGPEVMGHLALRKPLFLDVDSQEMEDRLYEMCQGSPQTRKRYRSAFISLHRRAVPAFIAPDATIAALDDLTVVQWAKLYDRWLTGPDRASSSDWMAMRRALSRLLTVSLGYKEHPTRLAIMKKIKSKKTVVRISNLTPEGFWECLEHVPEHAKPGPVTIVATGFRLEEYLACGAEHYDQINQTVTSPHSKTEEGKEPVVIPAELRGWVKRGIPAPIQRKWLQVYWRRACLKAGYGRLVPDDKAPARARRLEAELKNPDLTPAERRVKEKALARCPNAMVYQGPTLHSLRKLGAQTIIDEGRPEWEAQAFLRHTQPSMTRQYILRKGKTNASVALGRRMADAAGKRLPKPTTKEA